MSVKLRPYETGGWEVDIRVQLPDGSVIRERKKAPATGKTAAQRWAEARERVLIVQGKPKPITQQEVTPKTTLKDFAPRFLDGYARANRQKPSGIASKETILRVHLVPALGQTPLDAITTGAVQQLKAQLGNKAPKTVNNVLTVLNTLLKTAVAWDVLDWMPCTVRLVPTTSTTAEFHDFPAYEALVTAAEGTDPITFLVVLLGGEAGLRCGEIMALQWRDVDLAKRQLTVTQSEWKGHVTAPKSGRLRRVALGASGVEREWHSAVRDVRYEVSSEITLDGDRHIDTVQGPYEAVQQPQPTLFERSVKPRRIPCPSGLPLLGPPRFVGGEQPTYPDVRFVQIADRSHASQASTDLLFDVPQGLLEAWDRWIRLREDLFGVRCPPPRHVTKHNQVRHPWRPGGKSWFRDPFAGGHLGPKATGREQQVGASAGLGEPDIGDSKPLGDGPGSQDIARRLGPPSRDQNETRRL